MSYDLDDWHEENCSKPSDDEEADFSSDEQEFDEHHNQNVIKNQTKEG